MLSKLQSLKYSTHLLFACVLLLGVSSEARTQSLDAATPAPIRSNNLIGKIAARDLGDSRLTDHYYAFTGTPGDLMITIQSRNLNGDLDVFTAGSLRPLLKLNLYAENTAPVTKGIYLRKREELILRIEARSPNDDEGTYQMFFGGSFEPIAGGPEIAETETPSTDTGNFTADRKTKRVSSVGARLPEPEKPVTEVAAAPTPTPEPPEVKEKTEEPKEEKPKPAPRTRATAANTPRNRRPPPRRTPTTTPAKPKAETVTTDESNKEKTEESVSEAPKTKPTTTRNTTKRGTTSSTRSTKTKPETPAEAEPAPEPEMGPRLVIETSDGTLINRSMSTVRRVVVENGQVVVTAKDGKIDRIPLTNVVRMSIAP